MLKIFKFSFLSAAVLLTVFAHADTSTITTEGVADDIDKHRRSPLLSVTTSVEGKTARILADADIPNSDFKKYPVRFDFFVNRRLFSSQIRSPELPGAVGVDIGSDIASPPFNYSVVATVLHPNRQYVTVLNGAVFESNLIASLDCTLTVDADPDNADAIDYSAFDVTGIQTGNTTFTLTFTGTSADDKEAVFSATIAIDGTTATATSSVRENGITRNLDLSGDIIKSSSGLSAVSLASVDSRTTVECQ